MSEIINDQSSKKNKRWNRRSTRVDLTPMVDLGFLLITFFVFTTTMSEQMAMKVVMPIDKGPKDEVCESCVLTVLLEGNSSIRYYEGTLENGQTLRATSYSAAGIRQVLMEKKKAVKRTRGKEEAFILIIKPTGAASFRNFVDLVDEVAICDIKRYYIDELNPSDEKALLTAR